MSRDPTALDRLHAIADELAGRGDTWFAQCLSRLESGAGLEAFELFPGWRAFARGRRNRIIRRIAAERFPGTSARTVAETIMRRPDLLAQMSGRMSVEIVRRALAHAPARNEPALRTGSRHDSNTGTGSANGG